MYFNKHMILSADERSICFRIPSETRPDEYHYVEWDVYDGWICTCEHHHYRKKYCKHMDQAKEYLKTIGASCLNSDKTYHEIKAEKQVNYEENKLIV